MDEGQSGPTLVSTGARGGWKLPALVVLVLLVGLVAITRLGGSQRPSPAPSSGLALGASQGPTLTALPTPTPQPTRAPISAGYLTGAMPLAADGVTYADGIPIGISGEPVYRVRDALLMPLGRTMLVGGWYRSRDCHPVGQSHCPAATMSDVPLDTAQRDLSTYFVALDERLVGSGAHIVLATVEPDPDCWISSGTACQPRLRVLQQIWSDAG
jgi:hypothetical protein